MGVAGGVGGKPAAELGRIKAAAEVDEVVNVPFGAEAPGVINGGREDLLLAEGCVVIGGDGGG